MGHIFISFSSKDLAQAERICRAIEAAGHRCWISNRDVPLGGNYQEAIVSAIQSAKAMLLVFSANANKSPEIKKEIAIASQSNIDVLPVRIENVTPTGAFRLELATRQYVDLFPVWDDAIRRLTDRIAAIVEPFPPQPRTVKEKIEVTSASVVSNQSAGNNVENAFNKNEKKSDNNNKSLVKFGGIAGVFVVLFLSVWFRKDIISNKQIEPKKNIELTPEPPKNIELSKPGEPANRKSGPAVQPLVVNKPSPVVPTETGLTPNTALPSRDQYPLDLPAFRAAADSRDPDQLAQFIKAYPESPLIGAAATMREQYLRERSAAAQLPVPRPAPALQQEASIQPQQRLPAEARPGDSARPAQQPAQCPLSLERADFNSAGIGRFSIRTSCGQIGNLIIDYELTSFTLAFEAKAVVDFTFDFYAGPKQISIHTPDGRSLPPISPDRWDQTGLTKAVVIWDGAFDVDLFAFENAAQVNTEGVVNRANPRSFVEANTRGVGFLSQTTQRVSSGTHFAVYTLRRTPSVRSVDFRINLAACESIKSNAIVKILRYQDGSLVRPPERQILQSTSCGPLSEANVDLRAPRARGIDIKG